MALAKDINERNGSRAVSAASRSVDYGSDGARERFLNGVGNGNGNGGSASKPSVTSINLGTAGGEGGTGSRRTAASTVSATGQNVYETYAEGELYFRKTGQQSSTIQDLWKNDPNARSDFDLYKEERAKQFDLINGKWQRANETGDQSVLAGLDQSITFQNWDITNNGFDGFDFVDVPTMYGSPYRLNRDAISWIQNRFAQDVENGTVGKGYDYYLDEDDQARKFNGQYSRTLTKVFNSNSANRNLSEMRLPPSQKLNDYLDDYISYIGDGVTQYTDDFMEYARTEFSRGWKYEPTIEDEALKSKGGMPVKVDAQYKDKYGNFKTAQDEYNFKHGLPPAEDMDVTVGQYMTYTENAKLRDSFYDAVESEFMGLEAAGIQNSPDKTYVYDDEEKTGADIWQSKFFGLLGTSDFSALENFVPKPEKDKEVPSSDGYTSDEYQQLLIYNEKEAEAKAAKGADPYAITIDYSDFVDLYKSTEQQRYDTVLTNDAIAAFGAGTLGGLSGVRTIGDYIEKKNAAQEEAERAQAVEDISGLNKLFAKGSVTAYLDEHPNMTYTDAFSIMFDANVTRRQAETARDYFIKQEQSSLSAAMRTAKPEEKDALKQKSEETVAAINAGFADLEAKSKERFRNDHAAPSAEEVAAGFQKFGGDLADAVRQKLEDNNATKNEDALIKTILDTAGIGGSYISDDMIVSTISNSLVYDSSGVLDADSAVEVIKQLADTGLTSSQLDLVDDMLNSLVGPTATMEESDRMRVKQALSEVRTVSEQESVQRRIALLESNRDKLGLTDFEFYNMLNRNGLGDGIDQNEYARSYYSEVEFPRTIIGDAQLRASIGWDDLAKEQQIAIANEEWARLSDEDRSGYVKGFTEGKTYNPAVHKTKQEQAAAQFGTFFDYLKQGVLLAAGLPAVAVSQNPIMQRAGANIASSAVGFVDMATSGIGGRNDRWQLTKDLSETAAKMNMRGKSTEQDVGSLAIGAASDATSEMVRMYAMNALGGSIGSGLGKLGKTASTSLFGATTTAKIGANVIFNKAATFALESGTFVTSSMGSYYNEAMESGATTEQAAEYGIWGGLVEGLVEKANIDSWVSGGGVAKRYAQKLATGEAIYHTLGYKAKVAGMQLFSSMIGEAAEEGISYGAGLIFKRATGVDPNAQFSSAELWESMFMGGLLGIIGSGMSMSSVVSPTAAAQQYMINKGYDADTFDIYYATAHAELGMTKDQRELVSKTAKVLDKKAYGKANEAIETAMRTIQNNNQNFPERLTALQAERDSRSAMLDNLIFEQGQASIDEGRIGDYYAIGVRINELMKSVGELDGQIGNIKKAYANENAACQKTIKDNRTLLDSHYVAMANLFAEDVAAMRDMTAAEMLKARADGTLDVAADAIDSQYAPWIALNDAVFGALDTATTEFYDAEELSSTAAAAIERAKAVLAKTHEKMSNARAGTLDQYQAQVSEAEQQMRDEIAKRDAALEAGLADKSKVDHYNLITVEDERSMRELADRLGVKVAVETFDNNDDRGYYTSDDGVVHINKNQPVNKKGEFLRDAPATYVFKHEFTHWLERSGGYKDFAEFVIKRAEEAGVSFDAYRDSKAADYAERGRDFDEDTAKREFVAEYVQDFMFNDAKSIKALVNANAGLAGKLLNKIQFTIAENKLRKSGTPEAKAMLKAEKLYVQAFNDAKVKPNEANKAKAAGESAEYSSDRKRSKYASHYNVDKVTQEQYDHYAWAIEHGDITPSEYGRFFSAIGETFHGNQELRNPDGVYVVLSYDESKKPTLLVGTDGNAQNPSTEFVVRVSGELSQQGLEEVRKAFVENGYDQARTIITSAFGENSISSSVRGDAKSYEEFYADRLDRKRNSSSGSGGNGRADASDSGQQRIGIGGDSGVAGDQSRISDSADGEVTSPRQPPAAWDDLRPQPTTDGRTYSFGETPGGTWDAWVAKYGKKDAGMQPRARDIDVPERTAPGNRLSDVARSSLESKHIRSEWVPDVKNAVLNDGLGLYIPQKNSTVERDQIAYIEKTGITAARDAFEKNVREGVVSDANNVLGMQLLAEAQQRGDKESVIQLVADLCIAGTDAGRALQVFSMLKKMGGVGSAVYAQKLVNRLNTQYAEQISRGKMDEITLSQATIDQMMNAVTAQEVADAESAMSKEIGQQLPLTLKERIINWRYLSMLANPTTHARNMFGNFLMLGGRAAKDIVAAGYERMFVKDKTQRAHAVYNPLAEKNKPLMEFAAAEYAAHKRDLKVGGKYGIEALANGSKRMFKNEVLNKIGEANNWLLDEWEDGLFMKASFTDAYVKYMIAQKLSPDTMTEQQKYDAAEWASSEALRATFRDASALADALNAAARKSPVVDVALSAVMPFKKTPINVAKRGLDYSPAGLFEGAGMLVSNAINEKRGADTKYTTAQVVDRFASGTVGTALTALGFFLAKIGVARGKAGDDDEYEKYLNAMGEQEYSIRIADSVSINMSAVAPMTIPLFMGVALYDAMEADAMQGDEDGDFMMDVTDVLGMMSSATDPLMEMSFMSSLSSMLSTYGSENALGKAALNAAKSYALQFLPTFGSKVAKIADTTSRTTKPDEKNPILGGKWADAFARSAVAKIPLAATRLEPYVNAKGEVSSKDSFADWALDFANQTILPARVNVINRDDVDDELIRLYESTGSVNIFPTSPSKKYFTVDKQHYYMDAKQFTDYSQDLGTAYYVAIKDAMRNGYDGMSDVERTDVLEKAISNAKKLIDAQYKERVGAYD